MPKIRRKPLRPQQANGSKPFRVRDEDAPPVALDYGVLEKVLYEYSNIEYVIDAEQLLVLC
jgi:hypothetical protein